VTNRNLKSNPLQLNIQTFVIANTRSFQFTRAPSSIQEPKAFLQILPLPLIESTLQKEAVNFQGNKAESVLKYIY
jgi:hypothetical protein